MRTEKAVMGIFAHADDVELRCGGTMSKFRTLFGYRADYVMSTNNMSGSWCKLNAEGKLESRDCPWHEMMQQRKKEADAAAREFYGTEAVHLDFPQRHYLDENLVSIDLRFGNPPPKGLPVNQPSILTAAEDPEAVSRVAELILERNPEVIFTHAGVDPNPEHTGTTWLVIRACRKAWKEGFSGSLLLDCVHRNELAVASESYCRPDTYIDISGKWLKQKTDALALHSCQSAGLFAATICERYKPLGQRYGIEAAEGFTVHRLSDSCDGELTQELKKNLSVCRFA